MNQNQTSPESQSPIKAIPTVYRGHHFRSRLEAKWAAFFDLCGWPWEYEPIDLNGYVPDFVLTFYKPLLVEVKPEMYLKDLFQHRAKIQSSGWSSEALIVGASIFHEEGDSIGILRESWEPFEPGQWTWAAALFEKCLKCSRYSFYHSEQTFRCRVSGCYDGDSYLGLLRNDEARRMFADASHQVQYHAD